MDKGSHTFGNPLNRDLQPMNRPEDGIFNGYSGHKIDLKFPTVDMIRIEDIATALSKICRFNGHIGEFYSVAQHCVLVSMMAPNNLQRAALLHDAAEAYLGDVIKPLKIILGEVYLEKELAFDLLICQKFKITMDQIKQVKDFDIRACNIEFDYFFRDKDELIKIFGPAPCWDHHVAKQMFLQRFSEVVYV